LHGEDTVFVLRTGAGHLTARERAVVVTQRLSDLVAHTDVEGFAPESLKIAEVDGGHELSYAGRLLIRATVADTGDGGGTAAVARVWRDQVRQSLDGTKADAALWQMAVRAAGVVGILLLIVLVELLVFRLARRARIVIARYTSSGRLPTLRIQSV